MTLTAKRSAILNEIEKLYVTEGDLVGDIAMLGARQYDVERTDDNVAQAIIDMNSALYMSVNGYYERGQEYNWNENSIGDAETLVSRSMMVIEADDGGVPGAATVVFDTIGPNVFTWPEGVTTATVRCFGAGGGSGLNNGNPFPLGTGGGGGGGGAWAEAIVTRTAATATVTIGAGGGPGVDGEDTTFEQGASTDVLAAGGKTGAGIVGGAGGQALDSFGSATWSGGNGGNSSFDGGGGGGSSAGTTGSGNNGGNGSGPTGGAAGVAPVGGHAGGAGGDRLVVGHSPTSGVAGGSGGDGSGAAGGTGGDGYCVVSYEPTGSNEPGVVSGRRGSFNIKLNEYYKSKPMVVGDALQLAIRQLLGD